MTEEQAKELLQKYLNQQASPHEQKKVEEWYASLNREDAPLVASKKAAIGEQMLANLKAAMYKKPKYGKVLKLQTFILAAAAILLIIGSALVIWKLQAPVQSSANLVTVNTKAAEHKRITLPDGSVVFLGPAAKLSYPKVFASNSRQLVLSEGEAFFDVAHQEKRAFTVHTADGINIKVLGTSFKVKSYRASKQLEVAVVTGKVAVSMKHKNLATLVKNEFLTYNKSDGKAAIGKTNPVAVVAIAFEGATLDQVIKKLEYLYNIKILLGDAALGKLKSTATFNSGQSPEEILDIICSLHHIRFNGSKNHKTFKIYR
ncbi:FecR family protein [Pedobacter sp. GSP4]|uniref:FecR family protein n=1 Tax=Pedobacter sp. GSP4 TaxID=3453716 RepID=UPI003EE9BB1E